MTEVINVKILHLILKKKWYEMQELGEKTEEYREITPYWCKRFLGFDSALFSYRNNYKSCNVKEYTHVCFQMAGNEAHKAQYMLSYMRERELLYEKALSDIDSAKDSKSMRSDVITIIERTKREVALSRARMLATECE